MLQVFFSFPTPSYFYPGLSTSLLPIVVVMVVVMIVVVMVATCFAQAWVWDFCIFLSLLLCFDFIFGRVIRAHFVICTSTSFLFSCQSVFGFCTSPSCCDCLINFIFLLMPAPDCAWLSLATLCLCVTSREREELWC